jgi:ABC-2 type transport system ATP-binding protein
MRDLAARGRAVFVSSHLMSEMALTADHVVLIGRGRLIRDESVEQFVRSSAQSSVRVRSPEASRLAGLLVEGGATAGTDNTGALIVTGASAADIGELAAAAGVVLHELTPERASLEQAYMELTSDSVEFHASGDLR